jgi:hypothetical protein
VAVEAGLGHADLLDGEIDAHGANAVLVEEVRGRRQNPVANVGPALVATSFSCHLRLASRTGDNDILPQTNLTRYRTVRSIQNRQVCSVRIWRVDTMDGSKPAVAVVGATGYSGRFIVADLLRRGITPIAISRNAVAPEAFGQKVVRRQATLDDAGSLDRALAGAQAVINTAGPFVDTVDAVASAALRAKIHYIDVAAEQGSPTKLFEKFDEPARKAGVVVLPAMAFFGGLSDLMVTALLRDWDAVDRVETFIGFDKWHPTQGTRNTIERKVVGNLVISGGKLIPAPATPAEKSWHFADPIGDPLHQRGERSQRGCAQSPLVKSLDRAVALHVARGSQ